MAKLTYAQISEVLKLDAESGLLFWRERPSHLCKNTHQTNAWNASYAGREALYSVNSAGYKKGCVFRVQLLAHRVIWLLHHGSWPSHDLDHINGIRTDNRISNLRPVTKAENLRNRARSSNNTSGVMGVKIDPRYNTWQAWIEFAGKKKHLGSFKSFDAAVAARKAAERRLGFHENHGRPL